jgi:hypothetical protein
MNAPANRVHSGMMLETDPMPGTRRAEALKKSNIPTVMEVIGGPKKVPRFVILCVLGFLFVASAWLIISFALDT